MAEHTEPRLPEAPAAEAAVVPRRGARRNAWPWVAAAAAALAAAALVTGAVRIGDGRRAGHGEDARRSAREREIARMIATLGDVREATVLVGHGAAGGGGASVALVLREGHALSAETASAVAGLVSAAVPGLAPEDVMVVDSRDPAGAQSLASGSSAACEGAAALRLRREVERALADKLRALFGGMGIDCVAVVSAEIDLDRVKEQLVDVDPKETGGVVVRDERGYAAPEEARGGPPSGRGASAGRSAALPGVASSRADGTRRTEFDVSRLTQEVTKAVGRLANVRASVVYFDRRKQDADGTWTYDTSVGAEDSRRKYKRLAVRALGLEDYDENAVEVQYMPSAGAAPALEGAAPGRDVVAWAWAAAATALAVAVFVAAALALAKVLRGLKGAPAAEPVPAAAAPEVPASERLRRDVARAAEEDMGRAAAILRRWIVREG